MKRKMLVIAGTWTMVAVAALFLAHSRSWAMEEVQPRSFGPHQFRMNQLLGPERVMDANPAAGTRGQNVPNLQRLNAILLQGSHTALRQQGPGSSPSGEIVAPKAQKIEHQMGRIQ